jgi:ABC transporter substrate binding protein
MCALSAPRQRKPLESHDLDTRREFITLLGGAVAWPLAGLAQEAGKIRRNRIRPAAERGAGASRCGRVGASPRGHSPGFGTPSVLPARDAAGHIPVVFVTTFDPVATGLVASLARPGGNITGMTSISGDVIAKRLQLVTELIPNAARIDDSCARSQPVRGPIRPRPRHGVWVSRCKSRRRAM